MNIEKLSIPGAVITELPRCIERFQINTPLRLAHFLAQCAHESGDFKHTEENLNYSAEALVKLFTKHFTKQEAELTFARRPEKIANRLYANRMGNGPEASGDGWLFRGRGYIQLTGRDNYRAFNDSLSGLSINVMNNPALVSTSFPLLSAAWFWDSLRLSAIADKGANHEIIAEITKKVNGGTIGLDDRIEKFEGFYKVLS